MPPLVRINFVAAVWLSVALGILLIAMNWPHGNPGQFSPGKGTVFFGLVVTLLQLLLWVFYYRNDEQPLAAATMGAFLALPVLTTAASDAANSTRNLMAPVYLGLAYLSLSHIVYAYFHWRHRSRSWLDP